LLNQKLEFNMVIFTTITDLPNHDLSWEGYTFPYLSIWRWQNSQT